jgi:hypothetical protein
MEAITAEFDVPPDQIDQVIVEARPFDLRVIAKSVALDPASPTKPELKLEEIK